MGKLNTNFNEVSGAQSQSNCQLFPHESFFAEDNVLKLYRDNQFQSFLVRIKDHGVSWTDPGRLGESGKLPWFMERSQDAR